MFGLWTHGTLAINWVVQPGTWEKGEDPGVSGSFLLGITFTLTVNCNCPRMMVEGNLIHGKRKGLKKECSWTSHLIPSSLFPHL